MYMGANRAPALHKYAHMCSNAHNYAHIHRSRHCHFGKKPSLKRSLVEESHSRTEGAVQQGWLGECAGMTQEALRGEGQNS